jgi:stress-induced morphogen
MARRLAAIRARTHAPTHPPRIFPMPWPCDEQGFLNMLAMMKRQAASLASGGSDTGAAAAPSPPPAPPPASPPPAASRASSPTMLAVDVASAATGLGPVGSRIVSNLAAEFSPSALSLVDESDQHAGHAGAKGFNGESHFALTIVSGAFEGVRSLKRHQMVYAAVGDDMPIIHALSIRALAPGEPGAEDA